ncbi:aldo/keto reductase [Halorussus sp. MSC15.2]|uniref:aldo/keto reductase n=1 Tax=Halorussus sp. MSC15.2 TaxID=2283638 RepID=UPI0013D492E5|nr:aldo/keto reductase [Halorussus sp. MSC15.2]
MGSVSGEQVREEEREGDGIDEAVAALSPPTTHGMPTFGLGTYQMDDYDECVESVRTALRMGYRHLDTAEGYDNEDAVGDAVDEYGIEREDLFLATKIGPQNLDYDHVLTNAEESLDRLGVEYVDLLYVHWPTGEYEATDTLEAFAELRQEGLIERIGVSNFTVELLEEAIEVSEEPIFANQVEMHPLLPQTELRQFCAQDDVDVELVAYSPIARGEVADVEALQVVADKHDATPQQVSLAWLREKDVTAIPKATSEDHLRENWLSLGVELDDEDVERIDAIEERRRLVDPDQAPWNQ